ncbi:MAG: SIMPL domain-containing protein [Gammaproteobacteria bacterium]
MLNSTKYLATAILATSCLIGSLSFANDATNQRTINVQGTGNVPITPNMATIQIAVETSAQQAKLAVQNNADTMTRVVDTLKKQIGKDDKISTSGFNLAPQYQYDKDTQKQILTGYQVTNYVNVSTKQLDKLGELLDAATQAGANRVDNLQFSHDQWHSYEQQALAQAVIEAQQTAEILAQAAKVSLGEVLQIQPQSSGIVPVNTFALAKAESRMASTPIEPGQLTVNMGVQVTYGIQ